MLENIRVLIENLNFGKIGFKTNVFEKAFHLILMFFFHKIQCFVEFLHNNAVFFKKLIFLEFRPIEPIFRSTEVVINICYESLFVSISARLVLDQTKHSWPIKSNFRSVENRIESFLKNWVSHVFIHFFKNFQTLSLSVRSVKGSKQDFCRFPPNILQGFPSTRLVRLFCPFFFINFMFSCFKSCFLEKILNLLDFGIFVNSSYISWNWSMGFCWGML